MAYELEVAGQLLPLRPSQSSKMTLAGPAGPMPVLLRRGQDAVLTSSLTLDPQTAFEAED